MLPSNTATRYLSYSPTLEQVGEDEAATFRKIAETFSDMGRKVAAQEGHAVRVSHAKPTALLTGELFIDDDLPPELAQGLAAVPGRHEALVRFAQGPGEILDDRVSTHRGMAVKLLGLDQEMIQEAGGDQSQDFVFEAEGKAFINANAVTFLANLRAGVFNAPSLSESVKNAVSKVARGTEAGLEAVGLRSKTLAFFGHPPRHPLAESYFSQAPMRWGDHVAKVGFVPTADTIDSLADLKVDTSEDFDAFRAAMIDHFARNGATFDLCVQLAIDAENNPIEDAAVEWPEDDNPYRPVGRLSLPPQPAWSSQRDAWFERLSFRPAHSLAAHRPLGQVMRARLFVYGQMVAQRLRDNREQPAEPLSLADVPH